MRLRTFTARTMPEALKLITAELGDDAVILSTKETTTGVTVTAAMEPDRLERAPISKPQPHPVLGKRTQTSATTNSKATHDGLVDRLRYDVQATLRFHNIPEHFIAKMLAHLTDSTTANIFARRRMNIADESKFFLELALEHICAQSFQFQKPVSFPERIMLVGTPGIGKTLTIAKLATEYTLARTSPIVITTDVSRAGGVEQLRAFTDILGIELMICSNAKELAREIKNANKATPLLIDTAGCNPYDDNALATLATLATLPGIEPVLVMPAGTDAQEAMDSAELFLQLPIHRMMITRSDSTRRFGGMVAVANAHKLALTLIGNSASVTDPLKQADAKYLASLLLAYQQKPQGLTSLNQLQSQLTPVT